MSDPNPEQAGCLGIVMRLFMGMTLVMTALVTLVILL